MLVKLLLRHAVRAAEIAAVHDRDAQVVQRPAEPIERIVSRLECRERWNVHAIQLTSGTRW